MFNDKYSESMKAHSKSKTFPKGTEPFEMSKWIASQIETDGTKEDGTKSKYLITITRYTSKEEKDEILSH